MERTNRQSGFALLIVLMLLAIAVVLGLSYLAGAQIKLTSSGNLLVAARAKYLAESGIQHAMYLLQTDLVTMEKTSASSPLGPYYVDSTNDSYTFYGTKISNGKYQLHAAAAAGGAHQTAAATVTREPAAKVTTPATLTVGDSSVLGAYLAVQGNVYANGSLNNLAYIYGNASASGSITDTYSRITGAKTSGAPLAAVPQFVWSDFLTYAFYTQSYAATPTDIIDNLDNSSPLSQGGAVTPANPGGVVHLRPKDGWVKLDNLTFTGTLVIDGDIVMGRTVSLKAVSGFPAIVASGKIRIKNGAVVVITGLVKAGQGIWPEPAPVVVNVTITGGVIAPANGYNYDIRGTNVIKESADRATVYDFQCRDSLPKVRVTSWDD